MTNHTIFTPNRNPNVAKALIAGAYGGITNFDLPEKFTMGVDNKTEEFLTLNPFGKIPTLKTNDGNTIFESNAIARYVAKIGSDRDGLLGATPLEQAHVDQWIDAVSFATAPHAVPLLFWKFGVGQYDEEKFNNAKGEVAKALDAIERHLGSNNTEFLVSDRVTLADIVTVCVFIGPFKYVLDAEFRKAFPKFEAYFRKTLTQPHFVSALGQYLTPNGEPDLVEKLSTEVIPRN
jgi:elongation factor 1-gamma